MSLKIADLIAAGQCKAYWDLRKGSLLDYSGNGNTLTVTAGTPTFSRTPAGWGTFTPVTGSNRLYAGNPASLQLSTLSMLVVHHRTESTVALGNYAPLLDKAGAHSMVRNLSAEPQAFGLFDNNAAAFRTSTYSSQPGRVAMFAASIISGVANGSTMYVNGNFCGAAVTTVANQAGGWFVGWSGNFGKGSGGSVLIAAIINRVLSPSEHADLYDDWRNSAFILDVQHRRGVQWFVQDKSDADYAAQGIVLDTDFVRQPGGTVRDLTGNYPGTVTGVLVPGPEGEGITTPGGASQYISHGNVTQLNSASAFTLEWWEKFPSGNIPIGHMFSKRVDDNNMIRVSPQGAAANPKSFLFIVANGSVSYGSPTTAPLRSDCWQHVMCVYNGNGATNADKSQVYVDGELYAQTFTLNLPATTANLAAVNYEAVGYSSGAGIPGTFKAHRVYNRALSAGDARKAYLASGAQQCIWQAPGEDMPVSLVASYGTANPNALGGGWRIVSGTWKVSETTDGKRWIECVTAGVLALPQTNAFGTTTFRMLHPNNGANPILMFASNTDLAWNNAATNGYAFYYSWNGLVGIMRVTGGAVAAWDMQSAAAFASVGVDMAVCVNRRPSDGRFTCWLKGGAFKTWTALDVTGGSGTNPSAADATYTSNTWMTLNFTAGDKLLIHDPTLPGNPCPTRIYRGVLDPARGEVVT